MYIVKPYGRSIVQDKNRLILKKDNKKTDVSSLTEKTPELVIAQWVSAIDKIASKPNGTEKPTPEQRQFRDGLGDACWALIKNKKLIEEPASHKAIWNKKIHPYGQDSKKDKPNRDEKKYLKGNWYEVFTAEENPTKADFSDIAKKIYQHLYHQAQRQTLKPKPNSQGLIKDRAKTISENVLRKQQTKKAGFGQAIPIEAKNKYKGKVGNLAKTIREKLLTSGKNQTPLGVKAARQAAAEALYNAWPKVFGDSVRLEDVKDTDLFKLHQQIKDTYARLLASMPKDRKAKLERTLPQTMDELFTLIDQHQHNQKVNHLIRLGKIIHYHGGTKGVEHSKFWSSAGQAHIKRCEALVRVWRLAIAHAARTLRDWVEVNDEVKESDILLDIKDTLRKYTKQNTAKAEALFGNIDFAKVEYLKFALEKTADLRNNSFHFKGIDKFVAAMQTLGTDVPKGVQCGLGKFWKDEQNAYLKQVQETMEGAQFAAYLTPEQIQKIYHDYTKPAAVDTFPLPKPNKTLKRAENIEVGLPTPHNRDAMEEYNGLRCQYVALKMVYEKPFAQWFTDLGNANLRGFIDQATQKAQQNTQKIHGDATTSYEKLPPFLVDEKPADYFNKLSAYIASDLKVHKGYENDKGAAKKASHFVDTFKQDVIALAFKSFLEKEYTFLLNTKGFEANKTADGKIDKWPEAAKPPAGEAWQHGLYFLLHLIPVDDVNALKHQLRKWEVLSEKGEGFETDEKYNQQIQNVLEVLELYIARHDAKFSGQDLTLTAGEQQTWRSLFETPDDFDKLFNQQDNTNKTSDYRPYRKLREINRFGHLTPLMPLFKKHKITHKEVQAYLNPQADIAAAQKTREDLHQELAKNKKARTDEKMKAYITALQEVVRHRHLAGRVTLTDHTRLYRLLMAVLARLVDYAGHWERDVYFAMHAIMHQKGISQEDTFKSPGQEAFENGQIVKAVRNLKGKNNEQKESIQTEFWSFLGLEGEASFDAQVTDIRNNFAHFNMLQKGKEKELGLTALLNGARTLMAYDRKQKNAVAKSIIELLQREGLELNWHMARHPDGRHELQKAKITTRTAPHLGYGAIKEPLHPETYVNMVATLFAGEAEVLKDDVCSLTTQQVFSRVKNKEKPVKNNKNRGRKRHFPRIKNKEIPYKKTGY